MDRLKFVSARVRCLVAGFCVVFCVGGSVAQKPANGEGLRFVEGHFGDGGVARRHFLAYGLFPQEGDGEVVIRDLKTGQEWREGAGQLPPPPADDPAAEGPPPPRAIKLRFSKDSMTLVFLAYATRAAVEKAKTDKKMRAQEELVVFDPAAGKAVRVANVKSFQIAEKGDGFVVYQKYGLCLLRLPVRRQRPGRTMRRMRRFAGRAALAVGGRMLSLARRWSCGSRRMGASASSRMCWSINLGRMRSGWRTRSRRPRRRRMGCLRWPRGAAIRRG
jgi:hypothetical protein